MNKKTKFLGFLESVSSDSNKALIEIIKQGYNTCFEANFSDNSNEHKVLTTYTTATPEDAEYGEPGERGYADARGNKYTSDEDNKNLYLIMTLIQPENGQDIIEATIDYLNEKYANNFDGQSSFSDDGDEEDYTTGGKTTYTYHLQNYTEQEIAAIVDGLA